MGKQGSKHGDGQCRGQKIGQVRGKEGHGEKSTGVCRKGGQPSGRGRASWIEGEGRKNNSAQMVE